MLYPIQRLQHDNAIAANNLKKNELAKFPTATQKNTHDHPDVVLRPVLAFFDSFVHHKVHEGVEAAKDADYVPAAVQFQREFLVHEPERVKSIRNAVISALNGFYVLFQLWRVRFGHFLLLCLARSVRETSNKRG